MTENMRLNPLPAPHPVLSAVAFPRVHADEYPLGDREAYAQCYPRGLPVTYKMIYGVHSQGVAQTYLEDNLPIGFYTNIPPKAAAVISTSNGSRPFRKLDYIQPQRRLHLWSKDEIQAICNSLRKRHWNVLKNMQQPYCWDDLWTYFDAYDLYHNGCLNLWNVINTLWDENNLISVDVKREIALHIGHWADEWLKEEENQNRLTQWKESQGSIYRILNDKDHESLGSLPDDVVPLIASALKGRRAHLLSNKEAEKAEEPAGLVTTFRTTGIENWLTGQPVFDGNGLPPHPVSEPHRGPNYPAPCFSQNGKHYFLPPHCFSPPESVQKSAQDFQHLHNLPDVSSLAKSPKPGVVIVNGSNVAKPSSQGPIDKAHQPKVDDETVPSQNDTRRTSSMPEMSSSMMSGDGSHDLGRRKSQPAVENETFPSTDARRCSDSAALSTTGQEVLDNLQCMKREESGSEQGNPAKEIAEKQTEQDALHPRQSDDDTTEDLKVKSPKDMLLASRLKLSKVLLPSKKAIQIDLGDEEVLNRTGSGKALGVVILLAQTWSIATAPATSVPNATEASGFGKVDEVYPAAAMRKDAFIVRFESESSIPQAIAVGVVMVPEKDVRVIIQPVHRSKWITRRQSQQQQQQQQPRKLPPLPIMQQLSPSKNYAHAQVPPGCSLASSHTSTSEPDQHEIPSRPTSASTLPPQVFSSNQRTEQQVISPIDKPQRDAKSTELPAPVEVSVANCQHLASEKSREQAVDPTSFRLQATDSPNVEKSEKVDVSCRTASPSVVEKGNRCDITAADCDSSKLSLPKEALIALPSTPINSTCSSSDTPKATVPINPSPATGTGSAASKSNNGKAKSPSPIVMEGRQHQTSSAVGKCENVAKVQKEGDDETRASSDPSKVHIPIKDTERLPVATVASSEKHIESSKNGSAQVSIFTEQEIIERKKAWNRIPMPLDPRKSRKTGTAVAPSQQPSLPILNESSDSTTAKTGNAEPHTMKRDQPKAINTGPEQSTKAKESAKDVSLGHELGSAQPPPKISPESVISTATTATKEKQPQLSNIQTSGPHQAASEEIDAATSPSQATAGENNTSDATNSQMKPKSKWSRNKKSKKRPTLAPLTILQNEGSSQDVSPSVSEAPSLPKEELRAECHMPKPPPTMSESLAHPAHSTGKPDGHAAEPSKGPVGQAMANARSQYPYDTLPRSRHEFRNNAGGSLKVPKKRKGKYPSITSKTFEASAAGRFEPPPQPKYAASGQMPLRNTNDSNRLDSVPPSTEPDNSNKRSRLNPLATAFESPQKASAAAVDAAKAPNLHKAGSPRVKGGEEMSRENQSPSKFKIMQRSMAAHSSPVKSQQPKEKFVRRTDSSKTGGGSEMSTRQQENRPAEVQRNWSKDKHQTENERKELVSSKATSPDKMAALDKEDWPSLPGSRIRSATMQ